ncbi:MAG TPA: glycosyltransferase family 1 protein [Patescibacteria group bacterium]
MKIGVDCGCLGVKDESLKVGVYQIVKNTLIELSQIDKENEYLLYSFNPIEKEIIKALGNNFKNVIVRPIRGWMKLFLPLRIFRDRIDIFIGANQALPLKMPFSNYKSISIIYDIAFEKFPEIYSYAASVNKHKFYSERAAEADIVISISQKTKDDLAKIYHASKNKIKLAYPGIVPLPEISKYTLEDSYFLYVGALKKGKNIPTLIKAFAEFRKISKNKTKLLLAGGNKWIDPEIKLTLKEIPYTIKSDIHFLGAITKPEKLSSLYRGAIAFVSPSLYEGFGLPFVEAMSVGCPVIGSDRGSIPEIVGNSGLLFDAFDTRGIAGAMEKIATNKEFREALSKKGLEKSKKYSFKNFANAIYSEVEKLK